MDSPAGGRLRLRFPRRSRRFSPAIRPIARRGPTRSRARRRTIGVVDEIAAVIAAQQERRDAPPRGARSRRGCSPTARTVAVVTGQQAGLFGGPLFTLLKALTALKLAEQVSRDHGVPAVAVFWIDAEDHDWEEVRSCTVFDEPAGAAHACRCRRGRAPNPPRSPPSRLDDAILDVARRARAHPAADRIPRVRSSPACGAPTRPASAWPTRSAAGSRTSSATAAWSSTTRRTRRRSRSSASVFARELSTPGQTVEAGGARRLGSHRARLPRAGARAGRQPRAVSSRRRPPRRSASRTASFVVGDQQYPAAALVAQATEQPAGFSPNVLLRPIVQDTIVPDDLLRRRTERARVSRPAARRLRALRRADAAHVSARDGDAARFGGAALPDEVQAAARSAAGAGRGGAERAAQDADSAGRRRVVRRGGAGRSTRR